MKKFGFIGAILLLAAAFAMLVSSNAIAAPSARAKEDINVFNGRWFATREAYERVISERLKIQCNKNTEICKVEIIADWSNSCTKKYHEDTGVMLKGKGPVDVEWPTITINVDVYCLTKPPTYNDRSLPTSFTYNENDNTLLNPLPFGEWLTWHRGK